VTVRVEGATDKYTYQAVMQGLLSSADAGQGRAVSGTPQGERATFLVGPVSDVDAFAKRITCGTIRSVRGRMVTMVATKAEQPVASDPVTVALFELKLQNLRFEALRKLKTMEPVDQRRREVMTALREQRNIPSNFPEQVAEAMANWATAEDVPMLVGILEKRQQGDFGLKPIIGALGRLKDQRALPVLGDCLGDFMNRDDAAGALRAFGPVAEKVVLKQLFHQDWQVQKLACGVLATIGTQASIPSLEAVAASRQPFVPEAAEAAIKAIQARKT
jgi:hypothetical protein